MFAARRICPRLRASSAIEEPYLKAKIICPPEYTGAVMQLAIEHRGITTDMIHLTSKIGRDAL